MLADRIGSAPKKMSEENPFAAAACCARMARSMDRLNEIFAIIWEFGKVFENAPSLQVKSPEEMMIALDGVLNATSEHLLARALAAEGLALIDQIESELAICKRDPLVPKTPALQQAVQALENYKPTIEVRKHELDEFRLSNERVIETAMKGAQTTIGTLQNVAGLLKK